jgi:hypothetical protein
MGLCHWLTRRISSQPIAVQFGSDVIRFMQLKGSIEHAMQGAIEVALDDPGGISEALSSFKGTRCVACLPSFNVLVQHIRVAIDEGSQHILQQLLKHDARWGNAEVRTVCVKTTGTGGSAKQEILCVGVDRAISHQVVELLESAGAEVIAVTVPLYASIRAFDKLYRRDGDEKITSMLIDIDENSSLVMISHGANCVFAHRIESKGLIINQEWHSNHSSLSLKPLSQTQSDEFERRNEDDPRGLCGVQETSEEVESQFAGELERCLRHHDALFSDRAVDRVIFTGRGASDAKRCATIASDVGVAGFIVDPSAWISGAAELAGGPAWTSVAGVCIRYSDSAA